MPNPSGLCKCGCGKRTSIATKNSTHRGHVKGQAIDFVSGHNTPRTIQPQFPEGVIVDAEDQYLGQMYRWHRDANGYIYAKVTVNGDEEHWLLHRVVTKCRKGEVVDHKNHNRNDNRKSNLRVTNQIINGQNRAGKNKNNTSGYRGVCFDKRRGKWFAYGKINRNFKFIGYYPTPEAANIAAVEWRARNMPGVSI